MGVSGIKDIGDSKKEQKDEKAKALKEKERVAASKKKMIEGVKGIIRIAETDLDGTKKLAHALLKIKGVGWGTALAFSQAAGLNSNVISGTLTEEQMEKLEQVIREPEKFGVPTNIANRKADPTEGGTKHIVSSTLTITRKFDIDSMKKIHCYKGVRHELGLPVRGQRTRASFRTGMVAGVTRAKVLEAKKAAAAPAGAPAARVAAAPGAPAAPAPAKKEEKK